MAQIYELTANFDSHMFTGVTCAFGVFDGLHRGHQFLIGSACSEAQAHGSSSIALTFNIDPDELFRAGQLKKLMTNDARIAALAQSGVDTVVVLPFTREFASLSPNDFLAQVFADAQPLSLHVGRGFRFGAHAAGTEDDLKRWAAQIHSHVSVHDLATLDGAAISATRIRDLLAHGAIQEANRLLGRPYLLEGRVVPGRGEGADMGIRTANLCIDDMLCALKDGVYAAYVYVDDTCFKAAVNVGVAASFADRARANIEAHLLDFSGDLYGKVIRIEFVEWLRPMRVFTDIDELIETIKNNISWVAGHL